VGTNEAIKIDTTILQNTVVPYFSDQVK